MFNRYSAPNPAVWHCWRSRSAIANRLEISSALVRCSISHPFLNQSRKLTLVSDQEQLVRFQDARKEMVAGGQLPPKLVRRIDDGIDLPAKLQLGFADRRHNLRK